MSSLTLQPLVSILLFASGLLIVSTLSAPKPRKQTKKRSSKSAAEHGGVSDITLGERLLEDDVLDAVYAMAQGRAATPTFNLNDSGEDSDEWDNSSSKTENDEDDEPSDEDDEDIDPRSLQREVCIII